MERERGAAPNAGRGGKAEWDTGPHVGVRVEKLLVSQLIAADNDAGTSEITFKRSTKNQGFLSKVVRVVRDATVRSDFASRG